MVVGRGSGGGLLRHDARRVAQPKKYVFALVPKAMNNPFFDQARDGCMKAEKELKAPSNACTSDPASMAEARAGADRQDLIAKRSTASPYRPPTRRRWEGAGRRQGGRHPGLTWDGDLLQKDKALRLAFVGTHNYEIGVNLAKLAQKIKPKGGTICIQSGGAAAANHNERMQGIRDTLAGAKRTQSPGTSSPARMAGPRSRAARSTPMTTSRYRCSRWRTSSGSIRNLDAFIPTGGFPQFIPQAYRKVAEKYKSRIADGSLAFVVADTLPVQMQLLKDGLSKGQVGQRPSEMGYKTMFFLKDIKDGKPAPKDPTYTGLDVCTPETAATCIGK